MSLLVSTMPGNAWSEEEDIMLCTAFVNTYIGGWRNWHRPNLCEVVVSRVREIQGAVSNSEQFQELYFGPNPVYSAEILI